MPADIDVLLDGRRHSLSPMLVRSWCQCATCGDTTTGLRWLSPAQIDPAIAAASIEQSGRVLDITWSDGHRSTIDLDSIDPILATESAAPALPMYQPNSVSYDEVVSSDDALLSSLEALRSAGVVHISDAPRTDEATVTLAERFGPIRVTSYGQVQVFITTADAKTAAHTGNPQTPHTDEPFRYSPPGFLFFHMVEGASVGSGTTVLVDGFAAAEQLRRQSPDAFDVLASTKVEFHRQHEGEVRFSTRSTILTVDDDGALNGVRINTRCLAPLSPDADGDVLDAIRELCAIIEESRNQLLLHLHSGDMLVFDNHRIMHGRTGFSDVEPRHLRSCNVDRDEVHSRHRLLAHQLGQPVPHLATGPTT